MILFVSNYLNNHQADFCLFMWQKTGGNFAFLQTENMPQERIELGWREDADGSKYLLKISDISNENLKELFLNADTIILGDTSINIFSFALKRDILVLFYRERLFKKAKSGCVLQKLKLFVKYFHFSHRCKTALLCASAYASYDFKRIHMFKNRKYKWGYFPSFVPIDLSKVFELKRENDKVKVVWVGRLIDWKRTIDILEMALVLKSRGLLFSLDVVGTGELEEGLKQFTIENNLSDVVNFVGAVSQEAVRDYMKRSDIFVSTSDFNEGWGAVLNEAMNCACAVVVSHAVGAAPYLIKDCENGSLYKCGDVQELAEKVSGYIHSPELRLRHGRNAYENVKKIWNPEHASERLLTLIENLKQGSIPCEYGEDICCVAEEIKNNWYSNAVDGSLNEI